MPTTLTTVLLTTKGEPRKANLTLDADGRLPLETVQKYFRKKDVPEDIGYYELHGIHAMKQDARQHAAGGHEHDERVLYLIGYKKGKAGTENKTELPAPYDKEKFYGDILVVASDSAWQDDPAPVSLDIWQKFIDSAFDRASEASEESEESEEGAAAAAASEDEVDEVEDDEDSDSDDDISYAEEEDLVGEDEMEAEPPVLRRKKAAAAKVDVSAFKDELPADTEADSHHVRAATLKFLQGYLCSGSSAANASFPEADVVAMEKAIFRTAIETAQKKMVPRNWKTGLFTEIYKQIAKSVLANTHPESPVKNPRLLARAIEGEFALAAIPTMTSYEMYPERWKELADKQLIREQKILEGDKSRATDEYKCHRCGKRECTYYELQTRSADEPMTIFITCVNCGKRWRQ